VDDILHTQFGREQTCPKCGMYNRSGLKLPEDCVWCRTKPVSFQTINERRKRVNQLLKNMYNYGATVDDCLKCYRVRAMEPEGLHRGARCTNPGAQEEVRNGTTKRRVSSKGTRECIR